MSLINFVLMEYQKSKGNRTFLITVIGALLLPIAVAVGQYFLKFIPMPMATDLTFGTYLSFFSIIFAAVIINHLFTVDFETHTLKSIIPLPVSRAEYVAGKLLTLLVWMVALALITVVASLILFPLVGMSGFNLNEILNSSGMFLIGTVLLFIVMIPIAFVMVATKNTSATLVLSVLLIFLGGLPVDQLKYNPWNLPSKIATQPHSPDTLPYLAVIIVTGIIGYFLLRYVFSKRDIYL